MDVPVPKRVALGGAQCSLNHAIAAELGARAFPA